MSVNVVEWCSLNHVSDINATSPRLGRLVRSRTRRVGGSSKPAVAGRTVGGINETRAGEGARHDTTTRQRALACRESELRECNPSSDVHIRPCRWQPVSLVEVSYPPTTFGLGFWSCGCMQACHQRNAGSNPPTATLLLPSANTFKSVNLLNWRFYSCRTFFTVSSVIVIFIIKTWN